MLQSVNLDSNIYVFENKLSTEERSRFLSEIHSELTCRSELRNLELDPAFVDRVERNNEEYRIDYLKTRKLYFSDGGTKDNVNRTRKNADQINGNARKLLDWGKSRLVFSIPFLGNTLFPAFQFAGNEPIPSVREILRKLPEGMSNWEVAFWFGQRNVWLGGQSPENSLRNETEVINAAEQYSNRRRYH